MQPDGVVFLVPDTNNASGMVQGVKLVDLKEFVTDFAVEWLLEPVSPGLAWRDEDFVCLTSPLSNSVADTN